MAVFSIVYSFGQVPIADVYNGANGEQFTISGIVTTPEFGEGEILFFIQDESAGILVNYTEGECSSTQGEEIRITGTRQEVNGAVQVVTSNIESISDNNEFPEYELLDENGLILTSNFIGSRVSIQNLILEDFQIWPLIAIDTVVNVPALLNTTNISIRIDHSSYYNGVVAPCGIFDVSGVLTRFNNELRIMPFYENEVTNSGSGTLEIESDRVEFGFVDIGSDSIQSFHLTGTELYHDITIDVTGEFEVSQNGIDFTDTLVFEPDNSTINGAQFYIKYIPETKGLRVETLAVRTCGILIEIPVFGEGFFAPEINLSKNSISFPSTEIGTTSPPENFSIDAAFLTNDLTITASGDFTISLNDSTEFGSEIILAQNDSVIATTQIYVQFSPISAGNSTGFLQFESSGIDESIDLSGNGFDPTNPSVLISQTAISFGEVLIGSKSDSVTILVEGIDLSEELVIMVNENFMISLDGSTYKDSLVLEVENGMIPETPVYIQFTPLGAGLQSGLIDLSSGNVATSIELDGTGVEPPSPELMVNPTSLSFGNVAVGDISETNSISLSGNYLSEDVDLVVTGEFEIMGNNGEFGNSLTLVPVEETLDKEIFLRFSPQSNGEKSGEISISSSGIVEVISLIGSGKTPTLSKDSTNFSFGEVEINSNSDTKSLSIQGSFLLDSLLIESTADFFVSRFESSGYSSQVEIGLNEEGSIDEEIFIRFIPTVEGANTGFVLLKTSGIIDTLFLDGLGVDNSQAELQISASNIFFENTYVGDTSSNKSITLSGSNLIEDLSLSVDGDFEISFGEPLNFSKELTLIPTDGDISSSEIFIRFVPESVGNEFGSINLISAGINRSVEIFGIAIEPSVSIDRNAIVFEETYVDADSEIQSFTLNAQYLQDDILLNVDPEFGMSLSEFGEFSDTLVISQDSSGIDEFDIYVRFSPPESLEYASYLVAQSSNVSDSINLKGIGVEPEITLNRSSISFGEVFLDSSSAIQSFSLEAMNLTEGLQLEVGENFDISLNESGGYTKSLSLNSTTGDIAEITLYARFRPLTLGDLSENIEISSSGINTTITLNGVGVSPNQPEIFVNATTIDFGNVLLDETLTPSVFQVEAINLFEDLQISVNGEFIISVNEETDFGDSIALAEVNGTIASTQIYVKPSSSTGGTKTGIVVLISSGAETIINLEASISVPDPTIEVDVNTLSFPITEVGSEAVNTFTVAGSFLVEDIQLSSSTEFEISMNEDQGYSDVMVLSPIDGKVDSTEIFVRFAPIIAGEKSGTINIFSSDITSSISLSAAAVDPPGPLALTEENISVFPNPTQGEITLQGLTGDQITYTLITLKGEILFYGNSSSKNASSEISSKILSISEGVYLLKLEVDNELHKIKLIKNN